MARKSIEDVMNEIEDFLNSCKTTALSSNKVVVPRDEFDELFGDLKVKIPAEIDRCKKIMRNKDAILMEARRTADGILAEATAKANQMVAQTEIMALANQQAYETVELARVQANDMLAQAVAESNELRFGAMQYTNDIMMGIRSYIEATLDAERANYENLIATLTNDFMIADANLEEIQTQIVEFTGDPNSVTRAPQMRTPASYRRANAVAGAEAKTEQPKVRASVAQRVKQAVAAKEKAALEEETKPAVNIPDFITSGESVVPNETPLEPNVSVKKAQPKEAPVGTDSNTTGAQPNAIGAQPNSPVFEDSAKLTAADAIKASTAAAVNNIKASTPAVEIGDLSATEAEEPATKKAASTEGTSENSEPKKVKKKIVKRRNPVLHTPQTAQETVAKTLEAAAAAKVDKDKTVYKANGEQAREVPPQEGRVKRGPRVGRGVVEGTAETEGNAEEAEQQKEKKKASDAPTKSLGVVDDFSMDPKI